LINIFKEVAGKEVSGKKKFTYYILNIQYKERD